MPREIDIVDGLEFQYRMDAKNIQSINGELNALRPMFQKYNELMSQLTILEDRARVIYLMLYPFTNWKDDQEEPPPEVLGISFQEKLDLEKGNLSLWRVIREIVRQGVKVRIVQLYELLATIGHAASRQAIESALTTHKHTFQITKSGREKFVSLK